MVPQQNNLDRDLTARENLTLHAILHGIPRKLRAERIDEALDVAGLMAYRDKPVKTFSGGMKRRLVVVRSLLHHPRILFLDEPTSGLDPQIRRSLWELIQKINRERNTAVLMTTHYIEEAEKLCHRVKIISSGRVIADDTPDQLKNGIGNYVLEWGEQELFFKTMQDAEDKQRTVQGESSIREVSLEDVFIKLTGKRINV
jgi:ABC-2 type transport system ATP-binding protein